MVQETLRLHAALNAYQICRAARDCGMEFPFLALILKSSFISFPQPTIATRHAAKRLGLIVPELPPQAGDRAKFKASILYYLIHTLGGGNVQEIREHFGPDAEAIFELAIKLHCLLIMYAPDYDLNEPSLSATARTSHAVRLPDDLWKPLVQQIERGNNTK
jgi:hypothetical protein